MTLYYTTSLNTTKSDDIPEGLINPVSASNFSLWFRSQESNSEPIGAEEIVQNDKSDKHKEDDYDKTDNNRLLGQEGFDDSKLVGAAFNE